MKQLTRLKEVQSVQKTCAKVLHPCVTATVEQISIGAGFKNSNF